MAELAMLEQDRQRGARPGFGHIQASQSQALESWVKELEKTETFHDWVMPGGTLASAALDLARTTCRRADRRVCGVLEPQTFKNHEILIYLNRLSDLLWLLGRACERKSEPG